MRSGTAIVRFCVLMAAFLALSGMAGCPQTSDVQNGMHRTSEPADHDEPADRGTGSTMGGGMGMP